MARRLTRNTKDAVCAGVAAGFADYVDVDPLLVRLAFVFLTLFGGSGIFLYVVSWVLMPRDAEGEKATEGDSPGATNSRIFS